MTEKKCCEEWLDNLEPKKLKNGKFKETHTCPTCGQKFDVEFESASLLAGSSTCSVVGADKVK